MTSYWPVLRRPGVQSAAAGWPLPASDSKASVSFGIEGRPIAKADWPSESVGVVVPGYFETMRIPLVSGRSFGAEDGTARTPVMLINEVFARKYFGGEKPLGRRVEVSLGDGEIEHPTREIVGVVGNIGSNGLTAATAPRYCLPYSQAPITNLTLVIRTRGNAESLPGVGGRRCMRWIAACRFMRC